jgi:hypothetical protein
MAFEAKLSRFACLPDDVSEPTVRAPKEGGDKPKKKKPNKDVKAKGVGGSGDATAKKKLDKGKVKLYLQKNEKQKFYSFCYSFFSPSKVWHLAWMMERKLEIRAKINLDSSLMQQMVLTRPRPSLKTGNEGTTRY